MGNITTISAEIKTLVTAVQLSSSAAFVEVTEYPTNKFSGYPAASVVPSEVQSKYATVAQNTRDYGFMVELYIMLDDEASWDTPFTNMRNLVDAVLDALDKSIDLGATCNFLQAVPMEWTIQEGGQGLVLAVAIHVIATKDVPVY